MDNVLPAWVIRFVRFVCTTLFYRNTTSFRYEIARECFAIYLLVCLFQKRNKKKILQIHTDQYKCDKDTTSTGFQLNSFFFFFGICENILNDFLPAHTLHLVITYHVVVCVCVWHTAMALLARPRHIALALSPRTHWATHDEHITADDKGWDFSIHSLLHFVSSILVWRTQRDSVHTYAC